MYTQALALVRHQEQRQALALAKTADADNADFVRTSRLDEANVRLSGHDDTIFSVGFSPDGNNLLSSGADGRIFLWNVFGQIKNFHVFSDHKNAILQSTWAPNKNAIYSACADKTVGLFDAEQCVKVMRYRDHTSIVNCVCSLSDSFLSCASGDDSGHVVLRDCRTKEPVDTFNEEYAVTCVAANSTGTTLYTGSIDNCIRVWDVVQRSVVDTLKCDGTVTGLALKPGSDNVLASNSMDMSVRIWDMRPFVLGDRCTAVLEGSSHSFERHLIRVKWSSDGKYVLAGSSDGFTCVWDSLSESVEHRLSGHKGSVNDVAMHPDVPQGIVASASSDKSVILGELPIKKSV